MARNEAARRWWASEEEVIALANVSADVLRRGIESGLFKGLLYEADRPLPILA
jgi:hypothetical protein